ncbi:hypothetical protein FPQ18DRAFT_301169 [Pyronema domesticum]|uniref:Uncharacterized protein n=1 Tax=Pyronema omphalodes (strain CBS 100304) TaxID=1076935 RepID=U4LE37_PYROM|nr:hypothetical protein FPQ18DRAFT_301169 [Pyronema domesticum]CCX30138.1 Protein of unknown function [Pyronema omphalodes CBS 100304]
MSLQEEQVGQAESRKEQVESLQDPVESSEYCEPEVLLQQEELSELEEPEDSSESEESSDSDAGLEVEALVPGFAALTLENTEDAEESSDTEDTEEIEDAEDPDADTEELKDSEDPDVPPASPLIVPDFSTEEEFHRWLWEKMNTSFNQSDWPSVSIKSRQWLYNKMILDLPVFGNTNFQDYWETTRRFVWSHFRATQSRSKGKCCGMHDHSRMGPQMDDDHDD